MDLGVLLGFVAALAAILGADVIDGGNLLGLLNPAAALLVIGGTLGATAVSCAFADFIALPRLVLRAFNPTRVDLAAEIEQMVALALKGRRSGLLSLEEDVAGLADTFLARGLQLVVDGADADTVRGVLRTEMALRLRTAHRQSAVFETAGGFAPTMGIIGTVLGLIHVLANLSDAAKLGPSISTAFLATFYGICSANVFWLPLGNKLRQQAALLTTSLEIGLEGVLSIQAGDNPSAVRDKLSVFLQAASGLRPSRQAGDAPAEPDPGRGRVA